ncbi:hypothetical protein PM082_019224 [Marasmius tenuissimus]|nr:hypothetical protein PM082_019224 [Marasmius tenuissimus]
MLFALLAHSIATKTLIEQQTTTKNNYECLEKELCQTRVIVNDNSAEHLYHYSYDVPGGVVGDKATGLFSSKTDFKGVLILRDSRSNNSPCI